MQNMATPEQLREEYEFDPRRVSAVAVEKGGTVGRVRLRLQEEGKLFAGHDWITWALENPYQAYEILGARNGGTCFIFFNQAHGARVPYLEWIGGVGEGRFVEGWVTINRPWYLGDRIVLVN